MVGAGIGLTSCDPLKAEGDFVATEVTAESLLSGATFAQYDMTVDDNGKEVYTPSDKGNYIEYNVPSVPAVTVKSPDGKILAYGRSGGIVYYMPRRGSDERQPIQFCYINDDGTEVSATKEFTLTVAQAIDPALKVLVSNEGRKKWKWMPSSQNGGAVWGNGGYMAGEQNGSIDINGSWWGMGVLDGDCPAKFSDADQLQHAGGQFEKYKGQCYALSYMEFNEDGSLNTYDPDGNLITEGTFSIKDYKNNEITDAEKFSRGTLETSAGAILYPFAINTNGQQPTSFEIGWLDAGRMVLIYAAPNTEAWKECTWWSFMSDDDAPGILASHDWYWKPTEVNGGAVWGNGGYAGGSQDGTGNINNAWWGCGVEDGNCESKFSSQMGHAGPAYVEGEEYSTSRMVFNEDEQTITVYDKDGKQIRQGSFSTDMTPDPELFRMGTLTTSEGLILWPFAINTNGMQPTVFDIDYLSSEALILWVCPKKTPWEEGTWWSFGKKPE